MAEFKISRIRYTWKGNWSTTTAYLKDDVVRYGGQVWVCIRAHTANAFNTDQTFFANEGDTDPSPAWIKMADGFSFRGAWNASTLYNPGDIVSYKGQLYLTITSHTSSSEFDTDLSQFTVYSSFYNWVKDWSASTRYGIGDVVRYGGLVYKCLTGHTSNNVSNGLEADQEKWAVIFQGVEFKGDWATGVRYKVNDLVKYGGTLFRCKKEHTPGTDSTLNFDQEEHWNIEFPGFQYSGEWSSTITEYQVGDIVRHGGNLYYSLTNNYSSNPVTSEYQIGDRNDPIDWLLLSKGTNYRGAWSAADSYKAGDVVLRGGNLYACILDTAITADGSTLDYLDTSNWELISVGQNFRNFWAQETQYAINDVIVFLGKTYKCNEAHTSTSDNYPGDNGSGFAYWDLLLESGSNNGLLSRGDLLTYDLSRRLAGDGSTFGPTNVEKGTAGELLNINAENSIIYKRYGEVNRVFYVSLDGVDDYDDPVRGVSPFKPYRTIRFACEMADDGYSGTTTVSVRTGKFEEIGPIIVPARTVVLGSELRSTEISAKTAIAELANDSQYSILALEHLSNIIEDVIEGRTITVAEGTPVDQVILTEVVTVNVSFDPVVFDPVTGLELYASSFEQTQNLATSQDAVDQIRTLIQSVIQYINFHVNSEGTNPTVTGSNTAVTDSTYANTVQMLQANEVFIANEVAYWVRQNYPNITFDIGGCIRDIRAYLRAFMYDIIYTGNYKSILAARYYRNAVRGSNLDDMFYMRDTTGLRNCTLTGLTGSLNPPNVFDLYRLPVGAIYVSLDPGWGPDDRKVWILNRSPYIQGVTTIGTGCVGQKIDGALHNGGNKSMVSNDFTQVLSDGVGAWVANNGRAELVSVFTYYCHIGYLAKDGGIIRATNGNNSYGSFGSVADGVDESETPTTASVYNRNQDAIVAGVFAGDFVDEIQILEYYNAGQNYTSASATIVGSGVNADTRYEEFRDNAVFEVRLLDSTPDSINESIGGGGFSITQNNAQVSANPATDATGITIATNDDAAEASYVGKRIVITSGKGTGQYGYISAYNTTSKVVSVRKESTGEPGWDHVLPGKESVNFFDTSSTYRIEPRPVVSAPPYSSSIVSLTAASTWQNIVFGETTESYNGVAVAGGSGTTDGVSPLSATFNITKNGRTYNVVIDTAGAGYAAGDELIITGDEIGGASPENDLTITVLTVSDDSTNSILTFNAEGRGASGRWVVVADTGSAFVHSREGTNWSTGNFATTGNWKCLAAGNNRFVAIQYDSDVAAYSLDGITWQEISMPASRQWNAAIFADGIFFAVAGDQNSAAWSLDGTSWNLISMPTFGDSTSNEWIDIAYGKGKFFVIANSNNIGTLGTWDSVSQTFTWDSFIMDVIADSSSKDWISCAYGNNRYVAISTTGDMAYSFDGLEWLPSTMPTQDGSTAHYWRQIRYAQGVFFAVGDTGSRDVAAEATTGPSTFAVTSNDALSWTTRTLGAALNWSAIAYGNPYVAVEDSSVGSNTPYWVIVARADNRANLIRTGTKAKLRVEVSAGQVSNIKIWDPGSGYIDAPDIELIDPVKTSSPLLECRIADGVLTDPSWVNRGLGYRTNSARVSVVGNGFADVIPDGKFVTVKGLAKYYGPGAQITFAGNSTIYTLVTITELPNIDGELAATFRISPEIKVRDQLETGTIASIRERYSQCRITGHDYLDIGTGNFADTNYPELYNGLFVSAPENEVVEEDGGRVFYTSTDQSGNFRTGELFAVEQATGIVTISADFFDLSGLTELRLGGIRVGGTGAVIREFSTDANFTEDSNNIVPTQRAIAAYLANRLSLGGSEIATASFIAGTVKVGPNEFSNTAGLGIVVRKRADFVGADSGVNGSIVAQSMFHRSFRVR